MQNVILFGATGNLGKEIASELVLRGYELTVVVRAAEKAKTFSGLAANCLVADVCKPAALANCCSNQEVVVSALGKSVSPNDRSKPSFWDVDYTANANIVKEAMRAGVKKFVYISAFHAERYPHLTYFKAHHDFAERLKQSSLDYSIIKPPALFSAFVDVMVMARKGRLVNLGRGDKRTNPIFEGDLARIVVDSIGLRNAVVEAGGKGIYTRKELNQIIQQAVNGNKKLRTVPAGALKMMLPVLKLIDRNTYDKFSFFLEVMQHDTVAPQVGEMPFERYVAEKVAT